MLRFKIQKGQAMQKFGVETKEPSTSTPVARVRSGDDGPMIAIAEQKGAASALLPPETTPG
jgi:hypothetical protein